MLKSIGQAAGTPPGPLGQPQDLRSRQAESILHMPLKLIREKKRFHKRELLAMGALLLPLLMFKF